MAVGSGQLGGALPPGELGEPGRAGRRLFSQTEPLVLCSVSPSRNRSRGPRRSRQRPSHDVALRADHLGHVLGNQSAIHRVATECVARWRTAAPAQPARARRPRTRDPGVTWTDGWSRIATALGRRRARGGDYGGSDVLLVPDLEANVAFFLARLALHSRTQPRSEE